MTRAEWLDQHYPEPGPLRWIAFGLEMVAAAGLFFLMILTVADVGGRYLFNNGVDGAFDQPRIEASGRPPLERRPSRRDALGSLAWIR